MRIFQKSGFRFVGVGGRSKCCTSLNLLLKSPWQLNFGVKGILICSWLKDIQICWKSQRRWCNSDITNAIEGKIWCMTNSLAFNITTWSWQRLLATLLVKPRPNDRSMPTQHIATLLGATCCVRLATLLQHFGCCWLTFWPFSNLSQQHPAYSIYKAKILKF